MTPRSASWLSPDPLAEKYYPVSPYAYCANDPLDLVDPEGENPVYSIDGRFLGVDDWGLQGDYLVMSEAVFSPGMSHSDAISQSFIGPLTIDAQDNILFHYSTLSSRPDWDGYLTLKEANDWYRNGNGQTLYVSLSLINLDGLFSLGERYVDKKYHINLLLLGTLSVNDALVYGNIKLKRYPNNTVRAYSDIYDFDMKTWRNPVNWGRNIETFIGKTVAGEGNGYEIILYGSKKITPILPWIK